MVRLRNPIIGFIGKGSLDQKETNYLWFIGRCIARLEHKLALVPAAGAAAALREGFESEGGEVHILQAGVLEAADHTLVYPDPPLLERLRQRYEDIETRQDVAIIRQDQLDEWYSALVTILTDKNIPLPD